MESIQSLPALPIELWGIILLLACLPPRGPPVRNAKRCVGPIAFSQVCQSWRYLVLNCSQFWTDISYTFDFSDVRPRPSPELMQLGLKRSMDMPLTLDLDISDIRDREDNLEAYEYFLALLANRKRWSSAKLYLSMEGVDDAWEEIHAPLQDAPLLEVLKITVGPMGEFGLAGPFSDTLAIWWKGAPKLTKLAVEFMGWESWDRYTEEPDIISNWTLTNGIPYHQLTHLLLDPDVNGEIAWDEVASIFSLAQNLVSCSLHGIHGYYRHQPRPIRPLVVLQYLQHLDLSGPYDNFDEYEERDIDTDTLLPLMNQTLTAPSLQTLSFLHFQDMWDHDAYADFITRSNPPLTGLHFGLSPDESPDGLLECIRLSPPTLRYLHTNQKGVLLPKFTESMAEWDAEAGKFKLCPVLEQMMFDVGTRWFLSEGMEDMLRKRLCPPDGSSSPFNKINIPGYPRSESEANLKPLTNDPYHLRVEYVKMTCSQASVW